MPKMRLIVGGITKPKNLVKTRPITIDGNKRVVWKNKDGRFIKLGQQWWKLKTIR